VAKSASVGEAWQAVVAMTRTAELYVPDSTLHLWFIYYLLWFYLCAVVIVQLARRLPGTWQVKLQRAFRRLLLKPLLRVVIPATVTAVTLLPMAGVLSTRTGFLPDAAVYLAYFVFFGFGWLLYREHEIVATFSRGAWLLSIGATALYFAAEFLVMPDLRANGGAASVVVQSVINGVVVWMLFYGFTGLFLRYLDRPSARVRYIVDASYWVYLVHLPCTIWIPGLLVGTDLSVWSRMLVVLTGTTLIGFATYGLFVRSTWIGRVLNGRRYARGLPSVGTAAQGA
jgi:glucan biosynthesis protein C